MSRLQKFCVIYFIGISDLIFYLSEKVFFHSSNLSSSHNWNAIYTNKNREIKISQNFLLTKISSLKVTNPSDRLYYFVWMERKPIEELIKTLINHQKYKLRIIPIKSNFFIKPNQEHFLGSRIISKNTQLNYISLKRHKHPI